MPRGISRFNVSTIQRSNVSYCAGVAQLVERRPEEPRVGGSTPSPGTTVILCLPVHLQQDGEGALQFGHQSVALTAPCNGPQEFRQKFPGLVRVSVECDPEFSEILLH